VKTILLAAVVLVACQPSYNATTARAQTEFALAALSTAPATVVPLCTEAPYLITNEYAHALPNNVGVHLSAYWDVPCGSLFLRNGNGFTGSPVDGHPVATRDSSSSNNSAQLRMVTKATWPADSSVALNVRLNAMSTDGGSGLPDQVYDGYHVFLRWQSEYDLYAVSMARRNGTIVIKRKFPGGPFPSNGGTYYPLLADVSSPTVLGRWQSIQAQAVTLPDDGVEITATLDGREVMRAVDTGYVLPDGGHVAPITYGGHAGIRGDNTEFEFNAFEVQPL
jgi:hypothetical protein